MELAKMANEIGRGSPRGRLLDRGELLAKLPAIEFEPDDDAGDGDFDQASLARAVPALAQVDQEREHALCRSVAEHLLGEIPEPDDVEL
jgi:hypothetical protein